MSTLADALALYQGRQGQLHTCKVTTHNVYCAVNASDYLIWNECNVVGSATDTHIVWSPNAFLPVEFTTTTLGFEMGGERERDGDAVQALFFLVSFQP